MENWVSVLESDIDLKVMTKTLPQKGNLVYEYNPFRNYRIQSNMYEFSDSLYSLYDLYNLFGLELDLKSGIKDLYVREAISGTRYYSASETDITDESDKYGYRKIDNENILFSSELKYCYDSSNSVSKESLEEAIIDCRFSSWENNDILTSQTEPILREKGELVDFITDELNFSINNPVTIVPQYSYDGSVNLILNDGENIPRLINSRFSATGRNTYEIIDRKGDNDTNIYDQGEQFDVDTSLYKRVTKIPSLRFSGVIAGGSLSVGNYHFYFKLADADGNETDFVAESGLVSVFIGFDDPHSVHTGMADQNSYKAVRFYLSNIDASYDYVRVYYTRRSASVESSTVVLYKMIDKNYVVNNSSMCNILITGFETAIDVTAADINLQYNVVSAAVAAVESNNMLILGNVHRTEIPYDELSDLSLRFLSYVKETTYTLSIDRNYNIDSNNCGYYDPEFIYSSVGYWPGEYYRFGIVYIMPNNELTPVFPIRGRTNVSQFNNEVTDTNSIFYGSKTNNGTYNHYNLYKKGESGDMVRNYINMNEETYYVVDPQDDEGEVAINHSTYENARGVITFSPDHDTDTILSLEIRVDDDVIQELKKYVKGYFFVRQERMATTLCQGITIGVDDNAHTPTIPTEGGFLDDLADSLDESTYVQVEDINDVNYISEGFLTRYIFKLKKKSSGFWSTLGKVIAGVAIIAVVAVATVFTLGAAGVIAGGIAISVAATAAGAAEGATVITALGTTMLVSGIAVGATAAVGSIVAGSAQLSYNVQRNKAVKELKGRDTEIPSGYERSELDDSRKLDGEFMDRVIIMDPKYNSISAILCPDYETNQAFFNQVFTGNEHVVTTARSQSTNRLQGYSSDFFSNDNNHFYIPSYFDSDTTTTYTVKLQGVPDDVPLVGIGTNKYRSRAGFAEEAWQYESIGKDYEDEEKKINAEIVRGSFSPYIAMSGYPNNPCDTINIMVPGYDKTSPDEYIAQRIDDDSSFFAICDRYQVEDADDFLIDPLTSIVGAKDRSSGYSWELYRGDCYLCQVTHRLNRNFNDPSAPYNHTIIDPDCWKDNYDPDDTDKYADINLGDVNAVRLGMWVTFRIRSTYNLNIRTIDESYVDERAMCGHARGYYPYLPIDTEGCYKVPESALYNDGFRSSVSERFNLTLPDVPYIKNWFGTRIMYSDLQVNDAFKNGFRVFRGTNYIDLPRTYGEITKLINLKSSLLVIFEHGIGTCTVSAENLKNNTITDYINLYQVISQPTIISDTYGSQWPDSVMITPVNFGDGTSGAIYGVDTVAKKIWICDGQKVSVISDMRVEKFLNDNITLSEREMTPIIGIRNVKTVYNAFKRDVMFTFYDNLSGFEERVWNLCWNETLSKFITFYSWVPSMMENINNIPFSFNRNTAKWIAKLGISHADNSFADGITLTNNIIENSWTPQIEGTSNTSFKAMIIVSDTANPVEKTLSPYDSNNPDDSKDVWYPSDGYEIGLIGILGITGVNMPEGEDIIYKVDYSIERDNFLNYRYFEIKRIGYYTNQYDNIGDTSTNIAAINAVQIPVYGLYLTTEAQNLLSELYYRNKEGNCYSDWETNKIKPVNDSKALESSEIHLSDVVSDNLPIFKDRAGKRLTLDYNDRINSTHITRLLNIKANIYGYYSGMDNSVEEYFYNYARENASSTVESEATQEVVTVNGTTGQWVDCGYYESVVAVIPRWNMQFLSTDFWKHGQAGLIDIADKIYPAYWYGEQHPFEFEFVARNNYQMQMIFTNLEIAANKAKPESFHFEIVGDCYDFSSDKVNMYFRQEAIKALYQYNGADILYNSDFLDTKPSQNKKSADLPHKYYARDNTFNDIYDVYKSMTLQGYNYDHLTGSEIIYYPNMDEYHIWTHQKAVLLDNVVDEFGGNIVNGNCKYVEGNWHVTIKPIVICFKNEYDENGNSTWTNENRPKLPVLNSPLPPSEDGDDLFPNGLTDDDWPDCLKNIGYTNDDLDGTDWLNDVNIISGNRHEVPLRGKYVKVRIRYTGDELAIIDFVKTIYQISIA